jgi:hypothetical protein
MSTTTAPKRKRGVQRGKSALILFSHRSLAGLATFFLVSFQVVFWFASYFSGFLSGRFLVTCRWFSASILSGNCRHLLQYWCVRKGSHTSFRTMTSNHIRGTLLGQRNKVQNTEALPGRMEKPPWNSRMK